MGQAGRPRKTKQQKQLTGTLQTCREIENALSFEPLLVVPNPPEYLDEIGAAFFRDCGGILLGQGMLTLADIGELEQGAMLYQMLRKHWNKMMDGDGVQVTQSGYSQKTASWQIFMDCRKGLGEFYNKYGFNVTSRESIEMPEREEVDELDQLKNS